MLILPFQKIFDLADKSYSFFTVLRNTFSTLIICAAVGCLTFGGLQSAQAQTIPQSAEPGQIEKRFEPKKEPKSVIEPIVPERDDDLVPPDNADKIAFTLSGIIVTGSTVYQHADLLPLYKSHLGKEISLRTIYNLINAITAKYRNDGYILSRAILPPQTIQGGSVTIQIIEGYINKVVIESQGYNFPERINAYRKKIEQSRPLRSADLERYLLLIRDLAGIYAESVLRPDRNIPGASELVVQIRHQPVNAAFNINNRGTLFVGPLQLTALASLNSLLGWGEQTTARFVTGSLGSDQARRELTFVAIDHRLPLWDEGTAFSFSFNYTNSEPGFILRALNVESSAVRFEIGLTHPVIRSRSQNLFVTSRFSFINTQTDLLSSRLAEDRIRSLLFSAHYDFVDRFRAITSFELLIAKGLEILNDSDQNSRTLSRAGGHSDFTKVRGEASRLQPLFNQINMFLAAKAQYAAVPLLSPEEFAVGGAFMGRGYDPSEITGDHGMAGIVELQYGHAVALPALKDIQLYSFYDLGVVYQVENSTKASVSSVGGGIRANFTNWLSGYIEVAKPLTQRLATQITGDGKDPRVFFSLAIRY
jgi:hemolysin activation/secretion protein